MITEFINNLTSIWLESAPWLILGLIIAGLMKVLIPADWMNRQLGKNSRYSILKAAVIGAPLPLCSCGVVPAALGLRRAGASKGATVSFLVSTPETGPDSISLSYALLGPFMAIIRPIAAIVSAIVSGFLVKEYSTEFTQDTGVKNDSGCCASKVTQPSCCGSSVEKKNSFIEDAIGGLNYAFGQLLKDIAGWLIFGIVIAALIQTFVPTEWLAQWGSGLYAMLIMAVIGIPMYICASASTPIAAGFLVAGVSPGAILVFMLAGPATNIGTLGIIKKELGGQALFAYLFGVIFCALGFGFLTDFLLQRFEWQNAIVSGVDSVHHYNGFEIALSLILAGFIVQSLIGSIRNRWFSKPETL
ncbi:SO_0444 family Cu/Zn efflux transporter [Pleionea sediminis]|uniref:SO_0444 family Cu/Zn efflux transporter n=1 Tax=Pleionea sediminis TaxID=2569479 RepID=UPI001185C42B|nr:SO_0444 family Cu/Zn efflux transporter [Pleionea sediminis]